MLSDCGRRDGSPTTARSSFTYAVNSVLKAATIFKFLSDLGIERRGAGL